MSGLNHSLLSSRTVFHGAVFDVVREQWIAGPDCKFKRDIVVHPGAAVIVPQCADGGLLLVRQYRHAVRDFLLEFPAGTLEKGEDPLTCAKREIVEEVGCQAAEWLSLGFFYPTPGLCSEKHHCFLARGLSPAQAASDVDEILQVQALSVEEVERAIVEGLLCDAKSVAVFMKARLRKLL